MAGSFNHLKYDTDAYAVDLQQSTAPLVWNLDPNFANSCKPCFANDVGYLGRQGVSINTDNSLIDIDSNLKLLNYRNSRNPAMKYHPTCENPQMGGGYPGGGGIAPNLCQQNNNCQGDKYDYSDCNGLQTDYTRLVNPACTLRGTGVNRFQPMCLNFQDENRWLMPAEVGINYRMVVKDNHRPKIPVPLDQTLALPNPNAPKPDTTPPVGNCWGVFTGAMNPNYVGLYGLPYHGPEC